MVTMMKAIRMIENSDGDVDKSIEDYDDSISTQLIDIFLKILAHIKESHFSKIALILTM